MTLATCPNCHGRDSSRWPFGPCTICNGTGQTTPETAAATTGYDYEADIARGSNIRKPGERPWEASRRLRRERGLD